MSDYTLTTPKPIDSEHDPSRYDLFPTDRLKISGTFFKTRSAANGIGAPLVAVARSENPRFRQQYRLARVYAPVTAAIRFSGQKAQLEFVDPMKSERIAFSKRTFPLAVDLSAPTAMLIARERPERLGFARVMDPQEYADTARLCQLQQYDPNRTPVIFVHGLQETPASWTPMIDSCVMTPGSGSIINSGFTVTPAVIRIHTQPRCSAKISMESIARFPTTSASCSLATAWAE